VVSIRDRAVRRLKKRRDFHAHLLVYARLNSCLVVVQREIRRLSA